MLEKVKDIESHLPFSFIQATCLGGELTMEITNTLYVTKRRRSGWWIGEKYLRRKTREGSWQIADGRL
jgi:hypothetical protein